MMLGKRPRPPMKRTTSMSEITFDLNTATTDVVPNNNNNNNNNNPFNRDLQQGPSAAGRDGPSRWKQQPPPPPYHAAATPIGLDLDQNQSRVLAGASPRNHRKQYSADLEADDFLRSCSLCKRRLVPTRDIYMYRGDSAFCSLECRQQQMNKDERKDKCCVASKKQVVAAPPSGSQVAT